MRWLVSGVFLVSAAASAGELEGRVTSSGPVPGSAPQRVLRDQKYCGDSQPDESLVVGRGGALQNAVVYLLEAPKGTPSQPPAEVTLDQRGCRYIPHVVAGRVGDRLAVLNSDPILHNVNAAAGTRTAFNVAFPLRGQKR